MAIASDTFRKIIGLHLGEPQCSERITVIPMIGDLPGPKYISLPQAFENESIEVTEVKRGATVPELEATNKANSHILILEGEELMGAMQNRVLNISVLLRPESTTQIPVSCTESGRWDGRSAEFADSDEVAPYFIRSGMKSRVFESLKRNGTRDAGQSEVWGDIRRMEADFRYSSPTSAMKDTTRRYRESLDETVKAFPVVESQLGACVFIDDRMVGMEIVSMPGAFRSFWPRLMRSYALDFRRLDTRPSRQDGATVARAHRMISEVVSADWREFDTVGAGRDMRLEYAGASGSALVHDGDLVHLSVMNSRVHA